MSDWSPGFCVNFSVSYIFVFLFCFCFVFCFVFVLFFVLFLFLVFYVTSWVLQGLIRIQKSLFRKALKGLILSDVHAKYFFDIAIPEQIFRLLIRIEVVAKHNIIGWHTRRCVGNSHQHEHKNSLRIHDNLCGNKKKVKDKGNEMQWVKWLFTFSFYFFIYLLFNCIFWEGGLQYSVNCHAVKISLATERKR